MACASDTLTPVSRLRIADRLRDRLSCRSDSSDEELLSQVRRGDRLAFAELMRRHVDPLHAYLARLTASRSDAEDLTQETFLRIWQKAHSYHHQRGKVSTWIYRIAHNLCVDTFRKRSELSNATALETACDPGDHLEHQATREAHSRLATALAELPENQRAAVLLCQVRGFSNAEAAQIMALNLTAVESLLARARRYLREKVFIDEGDSR